MCLAVPGKLISISDDEPMLRSGKIDFGGIFRDVNLAFVPDAGVGDYLLVHAGIAIGVIDEDEAARVTGFLEELSSLESGDGMK